MLSILLITALTVVEANVLTLEGLNFTGWIDSIFRYTPERGIEAGNYMRIYGNLESENGMASIKFTNTYHTQGHGTRDSFDHPVFIPLNIANVENPTVTYRGPLYRGGDSYLIELGFMKFSYNWYIADFRWNRVNGINISNVNVGPVQLKSFLAWGKNVESPAYGVMSTYRSGGHGLELGYVLFQEREVLAEEAGVKELFTKTTDHAASIQYTYRHPSYGTLNLIQARQYKITDAQDEMYTVSHLTHNVSFPQLGLTLDLDWRDYDPLYNPAYACRQSVSRTNPLVRYKGEKGKSLQLAFRDRETTGLLKFNSFVRRTEEPLLEHFQTEANINLPFGSMKLGANFLYDQLTQKAPLVKLNRYSPEYERGFSVELRRPINYANMVLQPRFELKNNRFNAIMSDGELKVQDLLFWNVMVTANVRSGKFRGFNGKIGFKSFDYAFESSFSENNFQNGKHLWGEIRYRTPTGISLEINFCYPRIKFGTWLDNGRFRADDRFEYRHNLFMLTYRKSL